MKKDMMRFALVLGVISVVTALGVAGVYQFTRGRTLQKEKAAFDTALGAIFPDAVAFDKLGVTDGSGAPVPWEGRDGVGVAHSQSSVLGYLAVGEKQGYSSKIKVLVACDTGFRIKAVRILYAAETPGLGERAKEVKSDRTIWQALGLASKSNEPGSVEPWFQAQFAGKTLDQLVVVKEKTDTNIQAITAATITSKAVNDAVKLALDQIKNAVPPSSNPEGAR